MNPVLLARALGWFSLGLGAMEVAMPRTLRRGLGLPVNAWVVRAFGLREIAAGLLVLGRPDAALGPASRVAGDAMDLAVLLPALAPGNRRSTAAQIAFAMVLGVAALDVWCATALTAQESRRAAVAQRTRLSGAG